MKSDLSTDSPFAVRISGPGFSIEMNSEKFDCDSDSDDYGNVQRTILKYALEAAANDLCVLCHMLPKLVQEMVEESDLFGPITGNKERETLEDAFYQSAKALALYWETLWGTREL